MKRAFSLIELLVVMAIVAILTALTIPAISSMGRTSALNSAVESVTGTLDLARQTAITQNRTVEVRLYKLPDDGQPKADPSDYRGLQLFLVDFDTASPLTKATKFSSPTIISDDTTASSLMNDAQCPEQSPPDDATVAGSKYKYRSFSFKPDGTADLPLDQTWTLTVINKNDPIKTGGLPANYATVSIEPLTARVQVTRPSAN